MVPFTLRQLTFLAETARHGGIAQAARDINVSPAAVAAAIDKLEVATGLVLFDRFPARGMQLTSAGTDFLVEAKAILAKADALKRYAADLSDGVIGSIRIGTHYAIAQKIVLPAVLAFRESHPAVRIELIEDEYPKLITALDTGDADALVVFDQGFDTPRHDVEILVALQPLVLLPAGHRLAAMDSVSLSDLEGVPYIAISRSGPGPNYLQLLQTAGLSPEVTLSSQSRELVHAYVGKGLGFTLVGFAPHQNQTIEGDPVAARPLTEDIGTFRVMIARSRSARRTRPVDAFLDLCRQQV